MVCWQVKLCDPHLSALEVRFSRRGAKQIDHLYLFIFNYEIQEDYVEVFDGFERSRLQLRETDATVGGVD